METEELEVSQEELSVAQQLKRLPELSHDLQKRGEDLARIEAQMKETLRNSALLINGTLSVFEAIRKEQERVQLALREQGGEIQKRLSIYSEEMTSRLQELEERNKQEKEQEKKLRREADDQMIRSLQDKLQKSQKRMKSDLVSIKVMVAAFGSLGIVLLILFQFFF